MPNGRTTIVEPSRAAHQRGFTYLGLMIAVAIIGVTLAQAGVIWHTAQQRENENELLFVGNQFRLAIGRYYNAGGAKQFPQQLEDLLRDPRQPGVVRHLRKQYYDPITGTNEWGLVKDPTDRIVGVYSKSEEQPVKQANFGVNDREFEGKEKYSQWVFVYRPKKTRPKAGTRTQSQPGAGVVAPKGTK